MTGDDPETDLLLRRATEGERDARDQLLVRHRERLKRMVTIRLDRRVAVRVDPSDVVQETLADAHAKLPAYLDHRPLAFYPWLRQLAWDRLVRIHRDHVRAACRSVGREEAQALPLPDASAALLADRLIASGTGPGQQIAREELQQRVRSVLAELPPTDREVLVLRYLEGLRNAEIAEVLGIGEGAVRVRHVRALKRFRDRLDGK